MFRWLAGGLAALLWLTAPAAAAAPAGGDRIAWRTWSPALFDEAVAEDRYVLLYLSAVWCHWCHVMDDTTYRSAEVRELIGRKYIPVRVDQDSNPELSYRYERFGWPATIMFDGQGNEILRRRGYVPPEVFAELLRIVIDDPSALPPFQPPIEPAGDAAGLTPDQRARLRNAFATLYDPVNGGFGDVHRFVTAEAMEYALRAGAADPAMLEVATRTLDGGLALIDPVWGGMYQYSDTLDWSSPHFEKIMSIQHAALKSYGLAFALTGHGRYGEAARRTGGFLIDHLRAPGGGFYASHDADVSATVTGKDYFHLDDAERRAIGLPRRDENLYARENGWAITGLAALADATGDEAALAAAGAAAEWVLAARRTPAGGFGHGRPADDDAYLADNVAMLEAALALHRSSGERRWLGLAVEVAGYVEAHFKAPAAGFMAREPHPGARGALAEPVRQIDENVAAVRSLNLLFHYTGDERWHELARHGMRWLSPHGQYDVFLPGILLADAELARPPVHVTIVGRKDDPAAARLHAVARALPERYLRLEWWDRREGPLANPDVSYPELDEAAAFACAERLCSLPAFDAAGLAEAIRQVSG